MDNKSLVHKKLPPNETRFNDLAGIVSINLGESDDFNHFAAELAHYNPDRFKAIALKVFIEHEPVITLYAKDKLNSELTPSGKVPVRKFKLKMSLEEFFSKMVQFNFLVTTGELDIEDMEVMNR
jgi:hypothetical protein